MVPWKEDGTIVAAVEVGGGVGLMMVSPWVATIAPVLVNASPCLHVPCHVADGYKVAGGGPEGIGIGRCSGR